MQTPQMNSLQQRLRLAGARVNEAGHIELEQPEAAQIQLGTQTDLTALPAHEQVTGALKNAMSMDVARETFLARTTAVDEAEAAQVMALEVNEDEDELPLLIDRPWENIPIIFHDGTTINVPSFPSSYVTRMRPVGIDVHGQMEWAEVTEARYSPHVNIAQRVAEVPGSALRNLEALKRVASKEIVRYLQPGVQVTEIAGRFRMTRRIPRGCWTSDEEGLILHEDDCLDHAWDADGDTGGAVVSNVTDNLNPVIKNPVTQIIPTMRRVDLKDMTPEHWWPFTEPQRQIALAQESTEYTAESIFRETHFNLPLGIITNALHTRVLRETEGLPYRLMIQKLPDKDLYNALEGDMLKAVRKGWAINEQITEQFRLPYRLASTWRPFLTNTSSIGRMDPESLQWVWTQNLTTHMQDVCALRTPIEWQALKQRRTSRPTPQTSATVVVVQQQVLNSWPVDEGLIDRLLELGVLRYIELPHASGPETPLVMLTVHNRRGEPVGLTDIKRSQGVVEGISWTFLLLPVFSEAHNRLLHPMDWLRLRATMVLDERGQHIQGADSLVRAPGELVGEVFPTNWEQIEYPGWETKMSSIMGFISQHVGTYGEVPPVIIKDGDQDLSEIAHNMAWGTVIIDYGRNRESWQEMWDVWKSARIEGVWITPASKGDDRRVRKYAWAHANGLHPWWADTRSNPKRAAQIRSQLSRAILHCPMRVAITLSRPLNADPTTVADTEHGTEHQAYLTPSGISKQAITTAFGRRITHQRPPQEDIDRGHWERVEYSVVTGEQRVCWSAGPRQTATIGKLVDKHGQKMVPMALDQQAWSVRTQQQMVDTNQGRRVRPTQVREEIDMFMPVHELLAKDLGWMLDGAQQAAIRLEDGREILAWVVDMNMFRTGSATENMKTRVRNRWVKGIDAHMMVAAMHRTAYNWFNRAGYENLNDALDDPTVPVSVKNSLTARVRTPNLEYAETLKSSIQDLEMIFHELAVDFPQQPVMNYSSQPEPEPEGEFAFSQY